jgi:hypothetical protein
MRKLNLFRVLLLTILVSLLKLGDASAQCVTGPQQGTLNTISPVYQTIAHPGGSTFYYNFTAVAGGTYVFTYCSNGGVGGGDTYLTIADNLGVALTSNDDFCGLSSQITWTCPTTGTYRVYISGCCPCAAAYASTLAYGCSSCTFPAPTIASFTPNSGCGQVASVVITGTNFTGATAVTFGGTNAFSFVVNSPTQITAVPNNAATGTIAVVTPGGTATSVGVFTINASPAPPTPVTATPATICVGSSSNLNGTSAGNTISWFTTPSGGVAIGTSASGANFSVTPGATTTYYAEATPPGGNVLAAGTVAQGALQLSGAGTTPMGVVWNPQFSMYYAIAGGSPGVPLVTYNAAGVQQSNVAGNLDFRGGWWNSNTNKFEGNSFGSIGYRANDVNGSGWALGSGVVAPVGQLQPNSQSQGGYDAVNNETIFYNSGQIERRNRTTGAVIASGAITGLPAGNINTYWCAYSGVPGAEIMIYDYTNRAVRCINRLTFAYTSSVQLAVTAPQPATWSVGYDYNGKLWLHNGAVWVNYPIINIAGGGAPITQTFNYTGALQTFTVPAGVTTVTIDAFGAEGLGFNGFTPGQGGRAKGDLSVVPGQVLNIYVGGQAGFNGGGAGDGGANGGDASDVRVGGTALANRVIVAGGGGGTGGDNWGCFAGNGDGGGGTAVGANFVGGGGGSGYSFCGGNGGNAGGTSSVATHGGGGGGGGFISGGAGAASSIGTAVSGSLGLGGAAYFSPSCAYTGGGGGGYYGGGGAAGNNCGAGQGGGGSSWTGTLTNPLFGAGVRFGTGQVLITYTVAAPVCPSPTRTPVTVVVNPIAATPNPVTATPATICAGATSQLNSTGAVGSTQTWYTQLAGGVAIGTSLSGVDFAVTPAATTTYYVESTSNIPAGSQTFNYTGAAQTFTVPAGVTSITINAYGAQGVGLNGFVPGNGGRAQGVMAVTPGQVLNIFVGGTNAYNGGGIGQGGANGGGASDVRSGGIALADRVIVAGGGGGAGGDNWNCLVGTGHGGGGVAVGANFVGGAGGAGYTGGTGCGTDGGNAGGIGGTGFHGGGGGGGGFISGGTGAVANGLPAVNGTLGQGGASYNAPGCQNTGGGGGGYYGGGGAAGTNCGAGRGGGGSSWTGTLTSPLFQSGVQVGDGQIIISWAGVTTCPSTPRIPVTVTVNPVSPTPSPVTATPAAICPGGTSQLNSTAAAGNVQSWYTVPNGGVAIGTSLSGVNFPVTPAVTTTYYAENLAAAPGGSQTFNYTGAVQTFTVPAGVTTITMDVRGGQGGTIGAALGGLGARMVGDVTVVPGQVLSVWVGQQGGASNNGGYGGGGSGVTNGATPLVVAGAGGGGSNGSGAENGKPGLTTTTGGSSSGAGGAAGSGGQKGYMAGDCGWAGGGGGFLGDGYGGDGNWDGGALPGTLGGPAAGKSRANGGAGGLLGSCGFNPAGQGGWGCGGGARAEYAGGGGGGYSGGGGGHYTAGANSKGGGGGGSFNSGVNQSNTSGFQSGNGQVILTWVAVASCPSVRVPVTVTVNPAPAVTASASPATICAGDASVLTGGGANTYIWNPGALLGSPSVTPIATTTYTVTGTDVNGCTANATVVVTVNPVSPTPSPVTATPSAICPGGTSQLNSTAAPGNVQSWYTVPSGGVAIGTSLSGVDFAVTPAVTTTYYAENLATGGGPGGSQTFSFTGAMQTFTVPAGVTSVNILAKGAEGGGSEDCGLTVTVDGGLGGTATGNLAVIPGQVLNIFVGGKPTTNLGGNSPGGYNGGGGAGQYGGPGGGASDVRVGGIALGDRVIVAGGGGGGNTGCPNHGTGGAGGGLIGSDGIGLQGFLPGGGGSQVAGGVAGAAPGAAGTLGVGAGTGTNYHEGGGGGGYYGGGSAYAAGGGGGSSYIGGVIGGSTTPGVQSGNGEVIITWAGAAGFCPSVRVPVTVTVNPSPTVTASASPATICAGDASVLTGGGANTYLWDPGALVGSPSVNPGVTTSYTVTGTDANGCTATASTTVTVNSGSPITVTASVDPICEGSSTTLTATGLPANGIDQSQAVNNTCMANFSQTGLAQSFIPSVSTICGAGVFITSGGSGNVTIELRTALPPAGVSLASGTTVGNAGSYADVTWPSVPVSIGTTYFLILTSDNGGQCVAGNTAGGYANGQLYANAGYNPFPSFDYTFRTASCGGSYVYNPGNLAGAIQTVTPAATTTYTVTGTNASGCTATTTITVTVNPAPVLVATATPATTCNQTVVTPSASGAATIAWSGGLTNNVPFIANATTTYTVTGTDGIGCSASTTVLVTVNPMSGILAPATTNQTQDHGDDFNVNYYDASCDLIATVDDGAGGNILGLTTSTVTVDPGFGVHNGQPFVRRWYQITPTNNGAADVVLYINQSDFDNYNLGVALPYLPLPTSGNNADPNISNIRITKNTDAGLGNSPVVITPTVNWNGTYWELSFNTPSFSQFRVHSVNPGNVPLPATVTNFSGVKLESSDKLSWTTSSEQNNAYFNLQHSTDGTNFTTLAKVNSKAQNGNSSVALNYSSINNKPSLGHNYYRLQQVDMDGKVSVHAQIVDLIWGATGSTVSIYPNPTTDILNIDLYAVKDQNTTVKLLDMSGRVIKQIQAKSAVGMNNIKLSMGEIASGVYTIQVYENNTLSHTSKVKKNN